MSRGLLTPARRGSVWMVLAAVVSLGPLVGAFSTTRIFHVRDLGAYFWPRHLALLAAFHAREWPLWDSYMAAGHSLVADPLNQYFLLPVTLLRLVLPAVPGFNLWVAAPFPILAVGTWIWLRRHASPCAAFVAAAFIAVAGPVASTADFPNFSWSVCLIPWALWAVERIGDGPSPRSTATLAVVVGSQAIAGEALTFVCTCALLFATAAWLIPWTTPTERYRRVAAVLVAIVIGAALSAAQTLPLIAAARLSTRGGSFGNLYWSAHPLAFIEMLAPHVFGHGYRSLEGQPWLTALNDGREPLLYSLFVGPAVCAIAMLARADGADGRWRRFWTVVFALSVVCALGVNTIIYPVLQFLLPPLGTVRFPVKYLVFTALALGALLATGTDALLGHVHGRLRMTRPVAAVLAGSCVAAILGILVVVGIAFPQTALASWDQLARSIHLPNPIDAANLVSRSATITFGRLFAFAVAIVALVAIVWRRRSAAPAAAYLLCAAAILDPLLVNADLNPTMPAAELGPPSWIAALAPHRDDRVYVGGYVVRHPPTRRNRADVVDDPGPPRHAPGVPAIEALSRANAEYAFVPAPWHLRQVVSFDLPQLLPRDYVTMLRIFGDRSREAQLRFLQRVGVRYCLVPEAPEPGAVPLADLRAIGVGMALYECTTDPRRVYVAPAAVVEPSVHRQLELMFDRTFNPRAAVLIDRDPPAPSGARRATEDSSPSAVVTGEDSTSLMVSASVGSNGGYLVVLDSYDADWHVDVDGAAARLLRADGVFRAVRLAPGSHSVRFVYRPGALYLGVAVSGVTAVGLILAFAWMPLLARSRRGRAVAVAAVRR